MWLWKYPARWVVFCSDCVSLCFPHMPTFTGLNAKVPHKKCMAYMFEQNKNLSCESKVSSPNSFTSVQLFSFTTFIVGMISRNLSFQILKLEQSFWDMTIIEKQWHLLKNLCSPWVVLVFSWHWEEVSSWLIYDPRCIFGILRHRIELNGDPASPTLPTIFLQGRDKYSTYECASVCAFVNSPLPPH